jgi:CRP-like cAMP-binding protein
VFEVPWKRNYTSPAHDVSSGRESTIEKPATDSAADEVTVGQASRNALLAALPADTLGTLLAEAHVVELPQRRVLWEPGQPCTAVHFPVSGVVSLVTVMRDGDMVEVATVGREGMVGFHHFLGLDAMPNIRAICQIAGSAVEVDAGVFREASSAPGPLHRLIERYVLVLQVATAQEVACNRLHPLEMRCARWLMTTRDQVGADEFGLTQEFLAEMLGVRRATVTIAAGMLQKAGLIRYRRGWIGVLDPAGLESAACECSAVIRSEYERFMADLHAHADG